MYCPKCGILLPEDSVFCPQCGIRVDALLVSGNAARNEKLTQEEKLSQNVGKPEARPESDAAGEMSALVGKGATTPQVPPASFPSSAVMPPGDGLQSDTGGVFSASQIGTTQVSAQASPSSGKRRTKVVVGVGSAALIVAVVACVLLVVNPFAPRGLSIEDSFADTSLVTLVSKYDHDSDGMLTDDEVAEITQVDLSGSEVRSVQGIEHLTSVNILNVSHCTQLHELDLPQLPELTAVCTTGSAVERLTIADSPKLNDIQVDDATEVVGSEQSAMREEWLLTKYEYTGLSGVLRPQTGWNIESGSLEAEYDEQNRLVKLTDASRSMGQDFTNTTQYAYGENGRLSERVQEIQNGKRTVSRYTYDAEGRLTSDGKRGFEYDSSGCLSSIPGQVSVASENGRIVSMKSVSTSSPTEESFEYDGKGRVVSEEEVLRNGEQRVKSIEYDEAGNVVRITYTSGTFGYIDVLDYGEHGVISSARREYVEHGAISYTYEASITRDEHGNVIERTIASDNGPSPPSTARFTYKRVFVPAGSPELENVCKLTNPLNAPEIFAVPRAYVFPETPALARNYLSDLTSVMY